MSERERREKRERERGRREKSVCVSGSVCQSVIQGARERERELMCQ